MADKGRPSKDVNTSSVMEESSMSHQDHGQQTNKELLSFLLPLVHSSLSSPVLPPSDQVYLQASVIFQQLREEKPHQLLQYSKKTNTPLAESRDKPTQIQAYQLAFNTLKYQDLLEDIISDSRFHTSQHISADLLPLAMVMLFDFQDRRFLLCQCSTKEGEEPLQEVRALESSLHSYKTKLAASLARCRVKQSLQSVSCFLSDPVRTKQYRAKHLPLYAWVNTSQTSVKSMCEALQSTGLCEVKIMTDLKESTFCRDPLCPDTLVFSRHLGPLLQHSRLITTHMLNIQDRSVCVAVSVLRPLQFENGAVLVVGSFSAVTVAHIAVVAAARPGRVLVCGADHTPLQVEEIQELLTEMDLGNVRVLSKAFCGLDEGDAAIKHVKVIVVLPRCSSSALSDPVPTIHSEHGDWDLLPDLCHGSVSQRKMYTVVTQQEQLLAHAVAFPKVQTVVYCTRSVYPEENEQLVKRVLEKTHCHSKLLPFRVNGPIFPDDSQSGDTTDTKFFRLEPSWFTDGCFIAQLSRQADPPKVETIQEVLARAAAKGLLGGIILDLPETVTKGRTRRRHVALSPSSKERQTGKELINNQNPVAPSEHEEERGEEDSEEEGKEERKRRGLKVHKQKQSKQVKHHKNKAKKKRVDQSHHKKRLTESRPRRIPRLTLTLMSSTKPSKYLSPITALAHKLSENATIVSQQNVLSTPGPAGKHHPAPPAPHTASTQVRKQNTQPERAEKTLKDAAKPRCLFKAQGKVAKPEKEVVIPEVQRDADFVLPPISPSSSFLCNKSGGSGSCHAQLTSTSTPSSSVSLAGL